MPRLPKQHRLPWFATASLLVLLLVLRPAAPAYATNFDAYIRLMTLEQKVAQMFVFTFYGQQVTESTEAVLRAWQPGGVALLPSNINTPEQITRLTNSIQQTLANADGLPAFIAVDQEGGTIARLQQGFTQWPVPMLLTATQDTDLAYDFGQALATEMRAVGINMNLAPVADVLTNRQNTAIGRRSFGSSAEQVGPMVAAVVRGMQAGRVLATAKHFPGHGDTAVDSHLALPVIEHDWWRLARVEVAPFMATFDADVGAVMVAHIWYPALDPLESLPASLSSRIVTDLLRNQLAYPGLVITDALDMDAIDLTYSPEQAALRAVLAGNDLIITGAHVSPQAQVRAMQGVVDAVRAGQVDETRINDSVRRILEAKQRFGVLGWRPLEPELARYRISTDSHNAIVERMFRSGVTLAYDRRRLVPLTGETALVYPASRRSLRDACEQFGHFRAIGVSDYPTTQEIRWASDVAQTVDQIVVFTQNATDNRQQQALVRALPADKTVAVALWSPYDWLTYPDVASYLLTYSPLPQANEAVCAILFGAIPARGTLSVDLD